MNQPVPTDKFGTPINIGDTVVAAISRGNGVQLRKGEVVGFTKTGGIRVKGRRYSWEKEDSTTVIWPTEMMVVPS